MRVEGQKKALEEFQNDDVKGHTKLVAAFVKQRERQAKLGKKVSFNIKTFILEWRSRDGLRKEDIGEMMWHGEFLDWGMSPRGGSRTRTELEKEWDAMMQDVNRERDYDGPKGFLHMYVCTKTRVVRFHEVSQDRALSMGERLSRKATDQQMEQRMAWTMGADGLEQHAEFADFDTTSSSAFHAFTSGGSLSDITAADVSSMINDAKRSKTASKFQKETQKEEESEEESQESESGAGPVKKKSWFDADTKTAAAERTYLAKCSSLKASMQEVAGSMIDMTKKAASHPDSQATLR